MADATNSAKYERKRLETIKKLSIKGFQASFGESKTVNHRGTEYTELCKEYYFPLESKDSFKDIIKAGDLVIIISNGFNTQPNTFLKCGFMEHKGKKIIEIKKFPEGAGNYIYFEALIRG